MNLLPTAKQVSPAKTGCNTALSKNILKSLPKTRLSLLSPVILSACFLQKPTAPRVIITNALMVGMFDNQDWEIAEELGVANYGQMTAGGWMYIGPQGIVHGTFNTILGAGRKYLGVAEHGDLAGKLFVSSGLGGMSGAQPKAANIANAVGVLRKLTFQESKRVMTKAG